MINRPVAINKEIQGQAKVILRGLGLQAIKPLFFIPGAVEEEDLPDDFKSNFNGIPVFDNLILGTEGTSQDTDANGKIKTISGGIKYKKLDGKEIKLDSLKINLVLMDVSRQKNIVKTWVPGSDISIKEYITADDYSIMIRGAISSDSPYMYPSKDVKGFIEYMDAPVSIPITSTFLSRFGINSIVVENFRMWQLEGLRNMQFFEVQAISDDVTIPATFKNVVIES